MIMEKNIYPIISLSKQSAQTLTKIMKGEIKTNISGSEIRQNLLKWISLRRKVK